VIERADDFAVPLSTCRFLSSKADNENDGSGAGLQVEVPDLDNLLREAAQWRDDASTHPHSMTFFYIAGHGIQLQGPSNDPTVLLDDFGNGVGPLMHNSIAVRSLFLGMAPSAWTENIARRQLYFIDTGRRLAPPDAVGASSPSMVFDTPVDDAPDDRVACTFFASGPGQPAVADAEGLTLFGEVLLTCLNGQAASPLDDGSWGVTTQELASSLPREFALQRSRFSIRQDVVVSGLLGDEVILRLHETPLVSAVVSLRGGFAKGARLSVLDAALEPIEEWSPPPSAESVQVTVPAGVYMFELKQPGKSLVRKIGVLEPSSGEQAISLEE
jgi:hypothetical protein